MALYYPLPRYILTAKGNAVIRKRVEKGLNTLIASGEFEEMWAAYYGDVIKNINLEKRKVFRISNPTLSDEIPNSHSELWHQPKN